MTAAWPLFIGTAIIGRGGNFKPENLNAWSKW